MTIKEYKAQVEAASAQMKISEPGGQSLADLMLEHTSIWSNNACMGYCILAMRNIGYSENEIHEVLVSMNYAFDETCVAAAERVYNEF
jgi:hypothetical protein